MLPNNYNNTLPKYKSNAAKIAIARLSTYLRALQNSVFVLTLYETTQLSCRGRGRHICYMSLHCACMSEQVTQTSAILLHMVHDSLMSSLHPMEPGCDC